MKNKNNIKVRMPDLLVLIIVPLLSAALVWLLKLNFLYASLLFFGVPSAYLTYRNPSVAKRCLVFASSFLLIGFLGDIYAAKDSAWSVSSVFNFTIFGLVPLEDMVWFFLTSYMIISFYELFFDHVKHKTLGKRMPLLFAIITMAALMMLVLFFVLGSIGTITYFYFKSSIVLAVIPLVSFLYKFPRFISIFLKMTAYFFALFLLAELVGLHNGHWNFPGSHYLGMFPLGPYRIPYEEVLFFIIMFASVTVTYFEIFDDNRLRLKLAPFKLRH